MTTQITDIVEANAHAIMGSTDLEELENVIEIGQRAYIASGLALLRIKEARLYRVAYTSFEKYCVERWGYNRAYAYQLISACQIAGNLTGAGHEAPENADQARALNTVPEEEQVEVWAEVNRRHEDGSITAKKIKAVIEERAVDRDDEDEDDEEQNPRVCCPHCGKELP